MTLEELRKEVPEMENYLKYMPKELEQRYWIRVYEPGVIIHQKDYELECFGIIAKGEHRVINEFQNGNVFMIEKNEPIDIETLTETTVFYISRKDFEDWIAKDIHFLRLVAHKIAYKLYRSSYNRGARLFYPPQFILLDYVLRAVAMEKIEKTGHIIIKKTRQQLYEECGITVKTLNRTIKKLEEDRVISVEKGKITMNLEEYKRAREMVHHYNFSFAATFLRTHLYIR